LIAEDPHVRSGRSQAEREAFAQSRLSELTSEMDDLKLNVNDLDELIKVIKAKRSDLKDLQGRLKDQLKLCQEQIGLGQRWGSKKPTAPDQPKSEVVLEEDELDNIFAQALGQDKTQEAFETNASDEDLDSFLNSEINEDSRDMDDALDFTDILENI
jgi:seryl-tRNA synthetase